MPEGFYGTISDTPPGVEKSSVRVPEADAPFPESIAHDRRPARFQVQRARIVLAVAAGERVGNIARHLACDRTTTWRVCRRYRDGGVRRILADDPRPGRPQVIPAPPASLGRRVGVSGAGRQGVARHPLVQRRPGPAPGDQRDEEESEGGVATSRGGVVCDAAHAGVDDKVTSSPEEPP
ncbi:helix-turn-helix domain-containing protein [Urbifossiella limnaea]|uniref:helix-turn-helix domain-containing protein n=1 Tax=Urbifossiella limnaea TaxID=2528023 RepID=UPI00119EAF0F